MVEDRLHDMKMRIFNASPCDVKRTSPGGCWPYGTLYIYEDEMGQVYATFGDLTVPVTIKQGYSLMALARDRSIYRQQ